MCGGSRSTARARARRHLARCGRARALPGCRRRGVRGERHRHVAPPPPVGARGCTRRAGELLRAGRPAAHGASRGDGRRLLRRRPAELSRPLRRPDQLARVRAAPIRAAGSSVAPAGAWRPPADRSRLRSGLRGRVVLGADHHEDHRSRFGRGARWVVLCEDLPHLDNRVELSATLVDSAGLPAPKVTYRFSDDARRAIAWSTERATESLVEAGAHTIDSATMPTNSHLLGTARMGEDRDVVGGRSVGHDARRRATSRSSTGACSSPSAPPTRRAPSRRSRCERSSTCSRTASTCRSRNRPARSQCPDAAAATARPDPPTRRPYCSRSPRANASVCGTSPMRSSPATSACRPRVRSGIAAELLDAVLRARPDLDDDLRRGPRPRGRRSAGDDRRPPPCRPAAHTAHSVLLVLAAYYRSPDVQARIGWPGPEGTPVGRFDYPEYLTEGLLDHLIEKETRAA